MSRWTGQLRIVVALCLLGLVASGSPAYAGTLTSATFTAATAYAYTQAQNTRYDWGFTTASSSTLSKVIMSVPSGTGGANRYLASAGTTNGNSASTPDSPANSVTGDIDIRAEAALPNWNPIAGQYPDLVAKVNSKMSYQLFVSPGGDLVLQTSANGTSWAVTAGSTAAPTVANGAALWVRATLSVNNGSGGNTTTFYTSADGVTWNQLGSTVVSSGTTSIYDSTDALEVGSSYGGYGGLLNGKIYYAELRSGINGTIEAAFNPNQSTPGSNSWVSSTGETWTINRSGSNLPDDIATDLNVSNVTGLPTGGTANYRLIDGVAGYYFTPTAVAASTPCTVSLAGFTNTSTAGSYASTITTYDNSGTPAVVDSTTTATLAFSADSANTQVGITLQPSFTFSVANQASACNGESNFIAGAGTATAVNLGTGVDGSNYSGGQLLTTTGNGGGFSVYVRGTQATQDLRSSGHNWADVTGTYASPAALGAGERFGYTYKDISGSVSGPSSANFVAMTSATTNTIMSSATTSADTGCISYDAQAGATTPAGTYAATIIYTAVPIF